MLSLIASWPALAIGLCGDVNTDLAFDVADDALYRLFLADPTGNVLSPEGKANCTVIGPPRACDVLNRVVMARQARTAASCAREPV